MPFKLKIEVIGEQAFNAALIGLNHKVDDLTPVWQAIQPLMFDIFKEQFQSEGAAGSTGKWKKLSSPYKEIKAKLYGDQNILHATGAMEESMTGNTSHTVIDLQKQEAGFGTDLKYARFHQTGTARMPRRAIVALSDDQTRRMAKAIQLSLLDEIRKDRQITPFLGTSNNLIE
jgi:phage gpG-like protein